MVVEVESLGFVSAAQVNCNVRFYQVQELGFVGSSHLIKVEFDPRLH